MVVGSVDDWKSHVTMRVMGSTGYQDPVYFESGEDEGKDWPVCEWVSRRAVVRCLMYCQ